MKLETENDLKELVENNIEENTNLEYKDPDSLKDKKELAKDICAMANSDGGLIIYGLCEEDKNHKPTKIKWIEKHQEKERIEQILQTNVTPKIDVKIKTISNVDNSKFVLVVEVPKSDEAPHQDHSDKDKRTYWRRNGYTTREMEHYEIEDLFFKRKRPLLRIGLRNIPGERDKPSYEVYLENVGKVVAEKTYIKLITHPLFSITGWIKTEDRFNRYHSYEHVLMESLVYPGIKQAVGIIYSPKKFDLGILKLNFIIVCKDMEVLGGEILTDYKGNQKVTYEEPKSFPYAMEMKDYIFSNHNPFV